MFDKKLFLMSLLCAVAIMAVMAGCSQPLEQTARDLLAANKGALTAAQDQYRASCTTAPTGTPCAIINKDIAAQNVAVDALEAYCGSAAFNTSGAPCQPNAALKDKLTAALSTLNQDFTDVKGIVK
jgi:hypothetical protein